MEGIPKRYLYHMVPDDMRINEEGQRMLYPLNMLKEKFPELHKIKAEKYFDSEHRKTIPELLIPTLEEAAWGGRLADDSHSS